jgi:hypothetical protein
LPALPDVLSPSPRPRGTSDGGAVSQASEKLIDCLTRVARDRRSGGGCNGGASLADLRSAGSDGTRAAGPTRAGIARHDRGKRLSGSA